MKRFLIGIFSLILVGCGGADFENQISGQPAGAAGNSTTQNVQITASNAQLLLTDVHALLALQPADPSTVDSLLALGVSPQSPRTATLQFEESGIARTVPIAIYNAAQGDDGGLQVSAIVFDESPNAQAIRSQDAGSTDVRSIVSVTLTVNEFLGPLEREILWEAINAATTTLHVVAVDGNGVKVAGSGTVRVVTFRAARTMPYSEMSADFDFVATGIPIEIIEDIGVFGQGVVKTTIPKAESDFFDVTVTLTP